MAYSITCNLTNLTKQGVSEITDTAEITLIADTGYDLPTEIEVTGCDVEYDDITGVASLSNSTGNVTLTAAGLTSEERFNADMDGLVDIVNDKAGTSGEKTLREIKSTAKSIQSGGGTLYAHNISFRYLNNNTLGGMSIWFTLITNDNTPFVYGDFVDYVVNFAYSAATDTFRLNSFSVNGIINSQDQIDAIQSISYKQPGSVIDVLYIHNNAITWASLPTNKTSTDITFNDTVIQII